MDNTTMGVTVIAAALTLVGVVAITMVTIPSLQLQQAKARPVTVVKSCDLAGVAYNQSQGRCFNP